MKPFQSGNEIVSFQVFMFYELEFYFILHWITNANPHNEIVKMETIFCRICAECSEIAATVLPAAHQQLMEAATSNEYFLLETIRIQFRVSVGATSYEKAKSVTGSLSSDKIGFLLSVLVEKLL